MVFYGLPLQNAALPELDASFVPLSLFFKAHQALAVKPFSVAVERPGGLISVYDTKLIGDEAHEQADLYYIDRLVKFILWSRGGFRVILSGGGALGEKLGARYTEQGARAFDKSFMERVYERPFEVVLNDRYDKRPAQNEAASSIGRHLDGCRIGFDAGGSDRKVSAVINGEAVYSEEVVWHPKTTSDPDYHYGHIVEAFKTAASKMPRVDAIGISSAGVYVNDRCMVASLFLKVSEEDFKAKVQDIYLRAAKEIGDVPVAVANDGDVTALAGAMGLGDGNVLGLAMGTSEAVGYVDENGNITGWLNELAFAPADGQDNAMRDEWSGDIGCGVKYLSQDGVIKLAEFARIPLSGQTPAEKLSEVQSLAEKGDPRAEKVFRSMGCYLAHALALYGLFYAIKHVLVMGRVSSGRGGDILLEEAARVLKKDYPHIPFAPAAPDEKARRVGQSVAAAGLPRLSNRQGENA